MPKVKTVAPGRLTGISGLTRTAAESVGRQKDMEFAFEMSEWQKQRARLEKLQQQETDLITERMKTITSAEGVGDSGFNIGLKDSLMAQARDYARINSRMQLGDIDVAEGAKDLALIDKQLDTFISAAPNIQALNDKIVEANGKNPGEVGSVLMPGNVDVAKEQNGVIGLMKDLYSSNSGKIKTEFKDGQTFLIGQDGTRISLDGLNDIMTGENPEYPLQFVQSPDAAIDPLYQAFNKRTKNLSPYLVDKQITERKNGKDITRTTRVYQIGEDSEYKKDLLEVVQPILDDKKAMETYWPNLKGGQNAGPWVNDDNQRKEAQKLLAERAHNLYGPKVDVDETKVIEKPSLTRGQEISLARQRKQQKIQEEKLKLQQQKLNKVDQKNLKQWKANSQAAQQIVKNATGTSEDTPDNLTFLAKVLNNRAVKKGGKKDVTFRVGLYEDGNFIDDPKGQLYVEDPSKETIEPITIDLTNEDQVLNLINDVDFPKEEDLSKFDKFRTDIDFELDKSTGKWKAVRSGSKKQVKTEEKDNPYKFVKKGNDWYLNGEKVNEQFAGGFPFTKRGDSWYYTGEGENSKIVPGEGEYDLDINLVLDAKSAAIAKYENKSGGNAR